MANLSSKITNTTVNTYPIAVGSVVARPATGSTVSAVGTAGQIAQGHILTSKSFPSGLTAANFSYFNLSANVNDATANVRNLTNNASTPFTGTNLLGTTSAASVFNGTSQYLSSSSAFFNPGNGVSWATGGWFKPTAAWSGGPGGLSLLGQRNGTGADRSWLIQTGAGVITFFATNTSSNWDTIISVPHSFASGSWHHIAVLYNFAATTLYCYLDGKMAASGTLANVRASTSANFTVGVSFLSGAGGFTYGFPGNIEEVFFINGSLITDSDIAKLASYRYDHNANILAQNQRWSANIYPNGGEPVYQVPDGWLISKGDANSVFWDFSDLSSSDAVDVLLEDLSLTPTMVSPVSPYDVTYTATPTSPVAHGQPDTPEIVILQETGSANQWTQISPLGLVQADGTNLTIDVSSVSPAVSASPNRLRIIARTPRLATVGVPDATTARAGLVTTASQRFAGVKTFTNGLGGRTDATTPAAGSIGEVITATSTSNTTTTNASYIDFSGTVTCGIGTWLLIADGSGYLQTPTGTGGIQGRVQILNSTDSTQVRVVDSIGQVFVSSLPADASNFNYALHAVVTLTAQNVFKVQGQSFTASGTPIAGGVSSRTNGQLMAVRIA